MARKQSPLFLFFKTRPARPFTVHSSKACFTALGYGFRCLSFGDFLFTATSAGIERFSMCFNQEGPGGAFGSYKMPTVDGRNPFRTILKPQQTGVCWYLQGNRIVSFLGFVS